MAEKQTPDPQFEALLHHIQESRGLDFRGYKRTSLRRRVGLRMEATGAQDFPDYQARLEADPGEFGALLDTVLINVTSFFRDPEAWEALKTEVIPQLVAGGNEQPIRVWSVGCASGQEPYSIAMLLAEELGIAAFCSRVKIYATDLDEEALKVARNAMYLPREVEGVPADYLEKYFERSKDHFLFQRELRKCVIFGRHNVVSDAPISRIDLLVCRNLLIYLEAETQQKVLPRLHYALNNDGCLFLGKAETQLVRSVAFGPLDARHRIFAKTPQKWRRTPPSTFRSTTTPPLQPIPDENALLGAIVDAVADALLVIDDRGSVTLANAAARRLLGIGDDDLGRPFQDLAISYRPIELRGPIDEAFLYNRRVTLENQEFRLNQSEVLRLTVTVRPLSQHGVVLLSFVDQSQVHQIQQELESVHTSLEQSVEQLQSANEELETTNEELQSTNEELETTNEELQSTNEELETLNDETRSSSDEMVSSNEEWRMQTQQASEHRNYLESILRAMNGGIIVLDSQHRIKSWNQWSEKTWGLSTDIVQNMSFDALDIGLPLDTLAADMIAVESGRQECQEKMLEGFDRRGRRIVCRVRISPLLNEFEERSGLVLMLQDVTGETAEG